MQEPYPQIPQFPPYLPNAYTAMSLENVAKLRHYREELMCAGNQIHLIGENLVWKYDEREFHF
ncbi:hypothetical protein Hanom_Chr08g00711581 [Helianthus anomalus]